MPKYPDVAIQPQKNSTEVIFLEGIFLHRHLNQVDKIAVHQEQDIGAE